MARRMFSPDIVESDAFLEMPTSSQALYFHLGMKADDDGFVNPKMVMRMIGSTDDELKILLTKRFILPFESGVIVIKHWLIHNLIRSDLYKETLYKKEKSMLGLNEVGAYTELRDGVSPLRQIQEPKWLKIRRGDERTANVPQTALRIGKDRIGKDSKEDESQSPANINRDFFSKGEVYKKIFDEFSSKIDSVIVEREMNKFLMYWTEPNKSGSKVRWEKQETFDVKRRLYTWFSNVKQFQKASSVGRGIA